MQISFMYILKISAIKSIKISVKVVGKTRDKNTRMPNNK